MVLVIGEDCVGKPRSKVKPVLADRLKVDFCRQKPNRVVVLYDPFKLEHSLVKESWSRLLHELGQLIKSSYQRLIGAYETHIEHLRRECRERKCNYFEFFSYQEELAAVYESLSVFDEALNQYEQLESLFEELVSTFCETGRSMPWLVNFVSLEFSRIDPLGIVNFSDPEKRAHVRAQMANLFEFKLYLFSRKCSFCSLMQEYERIPVQAVRFLLGTLHQARLLKLDVPELLVDAWVLLSCLQVRHIVQRYPHILNSGPMADVCHLASRKLLSLGELCGLTVDRPSSEHIQRMLQLRASTAGSVAGDQLISGDSADQKMADWLSSSAAFREAFHELVDFSIGIYKHEHRARFAALASVEKADFYLACGDPVRAERFYKVALKAFKADAWPSLEADARRRLLACQRAQARPGQRDQLLKSLLHVAASPDAPTGEAEAAWSEIRAAMLPESAEADCSPNRIVRKQRLACEPLLRPLRLTLLADCPNRRQRALLRLVCAAPHPIDGVSVRCVSRGPAAAASTPSSESAAPPPKPPKPPKPTKPLKPSLHLLKPRLATEQQLHNSPASDSLPGEAAQTPPGQHQQLPAPLERSQSRLSARSLVPGDLVELQAADTPTAPVAQLAGIADDLLFFRPGPERCIVRFGDPADARRQLLLAASSSASRDSSMDSPEHAAAVARPEPPAGSPALTASGVQLVPGENSIVLEAQTPGLLEPGELLIQCGRLQFFSDTTTVAAEPGGRPRPRRLRPLCDSSWRDPALRGRLLPSLDLPELPPSDLLLHFEHRLIVRLRPGLIDLPGSGQQQQWQRPELRLLPLDGVDVDADGASGARLAGAIQTDADGHLRFEFACRAEPRPGESSSSGGRAVIRLAVAQLPGSGDALSASVELHYLRPVLFSHCVHCAGAKTYLSVHLRPNEELNETLVVSDPQLSLKSAKLLCNVEETLSPGCAVAYLWELAQPGPLPADLRLACAVQRVCDDSRAVVTYAFGAA
ncbi:hypothetical protein BOX15_Mlig019833g1 [Macrostomum lignano]|uniref:TRAPPC10/Trs130 N-terminal domain-containing protein n=2 Tax=Macrostomum lignano TaxID=282301 RepID=A0A267E1W1_9PLAT|nr:hypothetical protein BOX15_Mlig019833g1 [Macrostomum lignano]